MFARPVSLQARLMAEGNNGPEAHAYSRPPEVEGEATNRAIMIADMARVPVYIVHTSCEQAHEAIRRARQKGMRVYLRDERPIVSVQQRLQVRCEGEVSLILLLDGGDREVEVKLPGRYQATPQIAGALRAVPGVVQVEVN